MNSPPCSFHPFNNNKRAITYWALTICHNFMNYFPWKIHLILIKILWGTYCHHPLHFTNEETGGLWRLSKSPRVTQPVVEKELESIKLASSDFAYLPLLLVKSCACSVPSLPQEGYCFSFSCAQESLNDFCSMVGWSYVPWFPYLSVALSFHHPFAF